MTKFRPWFMPSNLLPAMLLMLATVMGACSDDNNNNTPSGPVNQNANDVSKSQYATRIEMPRLHQGNNYLILTRVDNEIGVNYSIEWDCINKAQRWTCWEWTKANNKKGWERGNWKAGTTWDGKSWNADPFQPDPEIPSQYRTELSDYKGSGYDRGHICASEDRICSQNVNGQTFYLSNMHPQINGFNAAVWAKMESKVRTWRDGVTSNGGSLYVCKGGTLYDVTINGKKTAGVLTHIGNNVPVPKYFFMAVVKKTVSGLYTGMAFWAEHKKDNSTDLTPYMITINELESRTGYDFFCNLPDNIEESMEGMLTTSEWK